MKRYSVIKGGVLWEVFDHETGIRRGTLPAFQRKRDAKRHAAWLNKQNGVVVEDDERNKAWGWL